MLHLRLLFCGLAISGNVFSQEIQNTLSYRNIPADHYFRINYENDLIFHTDYYYTQGVHFELVNPRYGRTFFKYLFPNLTNSKSRYGIGLESAGYTPMTIFADSILRGDRPFAGMAYLQAFMLSLNETKRSRLSAILSLGWMGPSAGGYEIQAFIHRYIGNPDPVGWKYQVKDQVIVNYELDYEKALTPAGKYFLCSASAIARAGTLSTKAALGLTMMAGLLKDPYSSTSTARKRFAYAYLYPRAELIGYDATLQGGPFTKGNPYTIAPADISRITFRCAMGLVLGIGSISLDASARYLTKEFSTGKSHRTGGLALAFAF